ncbi:MAG: hypothetical protein HND58_05995 [Planctomycetota bacterium]|nr:MAG: hypothetical protein HND58_05995 [Planctomycetota bacterium]
MARALKSWFRLRTQHTQWSEPLEARCLLSTGYFAAGIEFNDAFSSFREVGEYDDEGTILSATRLDSSGNLIDSPWAAFTQYGSEELYRAQFSLLADDFYPTRASVGFEATSLGFSGAMGAYYQAAGAVSSEFFIRRPTDLGTGEGGRDGSYFFNGITLDTSTGLWSYHNGTSTIEGLNLSGTRTTESGSAAFAMQLDPDGIGADGQTRFLSSSELAYFGEGLGVWMQSDLDDTDQLQSLTLGFRTAPGTVFDDADFSGDTYAISISGHSALGRMIGHGFGDSTGQFTFHGALEFLDNNQFRIYVLDRYFAGRLNASRLITGTFETLGDVVRLTHRDNLGTLDLKFSADLGTVLATSYVIGGTERFMFGGGTRIMDGLPGDFPEELADTGGNEAPQFVNATRALDADGTPYIIAKTVSGDQVRFNIGEKIGLDLANNIGTAWVSPDGRKIEGLEADGQRLYYILRLPDGSWGRTLMTAMQSQVPATNLGTGRFTEGGTARNRFTAGAFNSAGDLLQYQQLDTTKSPSPRNLWWVRRYTGSRFEGDVGVTIKDSQPGAPTAVTHLLVTPWDGWHLFYIDTEGDLRAVWSSRRITRFYDNNLSERAGLSGIDGASIDAVRTGRASMSVAITSGSTLHNLSWARPQGGSWLDTNLADSLGAEATGLHDEFSGLYFDEATSTLFNFAVLVDTSDVVIFRLQPGGTWQRFSVADDLGHTGYTVPEPRTIVVESLGGDGMDFELRGSTPGNNQLPILSRLWTTRPESQLSQDLLDFTMYSLEEPTDG